MKLIIAILPTVMLVVFSQTITKWRVAQLYIEASKADPDGLSRLILYLTDPYILSAYIASFLASIAWVFVVEKYEISNAFPVYIGSSVFLVMLAGLVLLKEPITVTKLISTLLIVAGVIIGAR